MTTITSAAYSERGQHLEATREDDERLLAMTQDERSAFFREVRPDRIEQKAYRAPLLPSDVRALLSLTAMEADLLGVRNTLRSVLDEVVADREADLARRASERAERDAAVAQDDRHPFYVEFKGKYVSDLASAAYDIKSPATGDANTARNYADAYAEYVAGSRKSKPSHGWGSYPNGRRIAQEIRERIDTRARALRTDVLVTSGEVLTTLGGFRERVDGEYVYRALTAEELVAETPTLPSFLLDEVRTALEYLTTQVGREWTWRSAREGGDPTAEKPLVVKDGERYRATGAKAVVSS